MAEPIKLAQNVDLENQLLQLGVDPLEVEQTIQENNPYEDPALSEQFRQSAMNSYIKTKAETPMQPKIQPEEPNIYDSLLKSMGQQEQYVDTLKKRLEEQKQDSGLQYLDLRPFAQALRSYGVSVEDPSAPMDRRSAMQALEDKIQQASLGLTKEQVNYLRAKALGAAKEKSSSLAERRLALSEKRLKTMLDQKALQRLSSDPLIKEYSGKINSIDRANKSILGATNLPVASLKEYQQNLRSAITTIKGSGGVTERAETFVNSAEQDIAKLKTYLTGELDTLDRNDPEIAALIDHLQEMGQKARDELEYQALLRSDIVSQTSTSTMKGKLKESLAPKTNTPSKKTGIMSPEEFMKSRSKK